MKLMFRRQGEKSQPGNEGYSVLDAQIVIRGDIETEGTLRVDGRLEGNVSAAEMVICGAVHGNIDVERRVELESTANVVGDLSADAILVHEGGTVRGRLIVRSQPVEQTSPPLRIPAPAAGEA